MTIETTPFAIVALASATLIFRRRRPSRTRWEIIAERKFFPFVNETRTSTWRMIWNTIEIAVARTRTARAKIAVDPRRLTRNLDVATEILRHIRTE